MTCKAKVSVVQENRYYPYGMLQGESSDIVRLNTIGAAAPAGSPRKYGGKELPRFYETTRKREDSVHTNEQRGIERIYNKNGEVIEYIITGKRSNQKLEDHIINIVNQAEYNYKTYHNNER